VEPESDDESGVSRLRILVVEDHPVNQLFVVRILEKRGHHATVAGNGEEALRLLEDRAFDVVLMDVQMPVMDGYQATARIREAEVGTNRHQTIIAMTAHAMVGDQEHCLRMGMDSYISKPVQTDLLFRAIEETLDSSIVGVRIDAAGMCPSRSDGLPSPGNSLANSPSVDSEFLRELGDVFVEDCPNLMANIRRAIDLQDASDLKRAAHTLKGSAGVFKDSAAFAAAVAMERLGRNSEWDHAEAVWNRLASEMNRLIRSFE
jgi:CheY-like chemotaxis protein